MPTVRDAGKPLKGAAIQSAGAQLTRRKKALRESKGHPPGGRSILNILALRGHDGILALSADASHRGAGSTRRRETIGLPKIVVKGRPVHEQWRLGLEVVQNH